MGFMTNLSGKIHHFDNRRRLVIPGTKQQTIDFCIEHFTLLAKEAIKDHGFFSVAFAGGSTPKAFYQQLTDKQGLVDWKNLKLFWSDERNVELDHKDSNYKMVMDSGFANLPIPKENIFPMRTCDDLNTCSTNYEENISKELHHGRFDLVMLGIGGDGHTASLFPETNALNVSDQLVVSNFVAQQDTWRLTLTFPCINQAHHIVLYVCGSNKSEIVKDVFTDSNIAYPVESIGSTNSPALWVLDQEAAEKISHP
jgi:6-phosphogluconolactonase